MVTTDINSHYRHFLEDFFVFVLQCDIIQREHDLHC